LFNNLLVNYYSRLKCISIIHQLNPATMKIISTLSVAFLLLTTSLSAQWGSGNSHDNRGYGNNGYNNDQYRIYNFRTEDELLRDMNLTRQQERKISRINEQSRQRSYYIQNDRFGASQQKRWQLERLEQQRRQDIMNVLNSFQGERYNAWCMRYDNSRDGYGSDRRHGQGNGKW
jgi:hypothetical protein